MESHFSSGDRGKEAFVGVWLPQVICGEISALFTWGPEFVLSSRLGLR